MSFKSQLTRVINTLRAELLPGHKTLYDIIPLSTWCRLKNVLTAHHTLFFDMFPAWVVSFFELFSLVNGIGMYYWGKISFSFSRNVCGLRINKTGNFPELTE